VSAADQAARWLAEAFETGNPLAPLPPELAPRDLEQGEAIAAALVEAAGFAVCGLRLAPGADGTRIAGPVLEGRLLPNDATLPCALLRHPCVTAAVLAVLAAPLDENANTPPAFSAIHPAIDIADSRFRDAPASAPLLAADLGGLGHIVVGKGVPLPAEPIAVALAPVDRRPRGTPIDLSVALADAAAAARARGSLPAGAVLVVAGLTTPIAPTPELILSARFARLGRARTRFT